MIIKRTIGDSVVMITLTDDEMYSAYQEKQHQFDICDIEDAFNGFSDDELLNMYGRTRFQIEEKFDAIACEMRRNIDKYDMHWQEARDAAIAEIL